MKKDIMHLIAAVAFFLSAVVYFVGKPNDAYITFASAFAVLSVVNIVLYQKVKKTSKK